MSIFTFSQVQRQRGGTLVAEAYWGNLVISICQENSEANWEVVKVATRNPQIQRTLWQREWFEDGEYFLMEVGEQPLIARVNILGLRRIFFLSEIESVRRKDYHPVGVDYSWKMQPYQRIVLQCAAAKALGKKVYFNHQGSLKSMLKEVKHAGPFRQEVENMSGALAFPDMDGGVQKVAQPVELPVVTAEKTAPLPEAAKAILARTRTTVYLLATGAKKQGFPVSLDEDWSLLPNGTPVVFSATRGGMLTFFVVRDGQKRSESYCSRNNPHRRK